jgi:hypothetical protein
MVQSKHWQWIPTSLSFQQFEAFVLPHLQRGRRWPPVKLTLHKIFNYILRQIYIGCQWKSLLLERTIEHACGDVLRRAADEADCARPFAESFFDMKAAAGFAIGGMTFWWRWFRSAHLGCRQSRTAGIEHQESTETECPIPDRHRFLLGAHS